MLAENSHCGIVPLEKLSDAPSAPAPFATFSTHTSPVFVCPPPFCSLDFSFGLPDCLVSLSLSHHPSPLHHSLFRSCCLCSLPLRLFRVEIQAILRCDGRTREHGDERVPRRWRSDQLMSRCQQSWWRCRNLGNPQPKGCKFLLVFSPFLLFFFF